MGESNYRFQKDFFANLQLNPITSELTKCWEGWHDTDFIPDYNKFYFIVEGEGWLKIGDLEFYPQPGQLFFLPAGILQSYSAINSNTFKKYWCHFTAKVGDINMLDIVDMPYFIDVADKDTVKGLFEEMIKAQESHKLYARLKEKALLLEIISYYMEKANSDGMKVTSFSAMEKIKGVCGYIEDHMAENITVEQLAGMLHFHPNYFTKVFRKFMGVSPSQYINKIRLEKAKYLLRTSDMNVKEVAAKTGFCDVYHFSKTFKKYAGFSPAAYKAL